MPDIRSVWDPGAIGADWILAEGQLDQGRDLETAVIISLFTDRLAGLEDPLPDGTEDRRGWWGDGDRAVERIGSRLWLLAREKATEEVRLRAIEYAREALDWLIQDGVARRVEVEASYTAMGRLDMLITITRSDGTTVERRYDFAWEEVGP